MLARFIVLGLVAVLLVAPLTGQDRSGRGLDKSRPQAPGPARRLAEVEAQLEKLLKEVRAVRAEIEAPASGRATRRPEINIIKLKNAQATDTARLLQQLLDTPDLRILADLRTNSVILRGMPDDLETAAGILLRLDEEETKRAPRKEDDQRSSPKGKGLPTKGDK